MNHNKLSIIVPTYKEAENIPVLARKIDEILNGKYKYELIVVDDDSCDGIEQAVDKLKSIDKIDIRLLIRKGKRGLSSAVIDGFGLSSGDIIIVMDADLSHPPEKIPGIAEPIALKKADFALGSRFVPGGSVSHFGLFRKLNAFVARLLARPFTNIKDPMSGFFAFPRSILNRKDMNLNPRGFKIALELLAKASPERIIEIPIDFGERLYGKSKLNFLEQINYLMHIYLLVKFKFPVLREMLAFTLVGGSGMIIDLTAVYVAFGIVNLPFRLSRALGFVFAITSNFLLNRKYTFPGARAEGIIKQYALFFIICLTGFVVNWFISVYLFENTGFFHEHYLLSAFSGIIGGFLINFTGSKFLVFHGKHGV